MSRFEEFERTYGPPEDCEKPPAASLQKYKTLLPPEILAHWSEIGWCAYGGGLLRFTDPDTFEGVIADWLDLEGGQAVVFLRTAFAHLYLWHEGHVYSLDVHQGDLSQVTDDVELFFSLLVDEDVQEKILRLELYRAASEKLGVPSRDECFAFVPALALGGPGTLETVQRVKIREHLAFLAQVAGK